ncbi:hypothetical protein VZT92_016532 [Zoarces viviparus]|uniref:Uncharacterized protein n=1 Tax=Zoarces viviparus TaxID=48416 RepID=A0AAW1ET15_ZOAVI
MSAVERRRAPEPHWENGAPRNQDVRYPRRLLARPRHPVGTSSWRPDGSRSAHHARRVSPSMPTQLFLKPTAERAPPTTPISRMKDTSNAAE